MTDPGPHGASHIALDHAEVELTIAKTPEEIHEYYRIRHQVFVLEQKMFEETDLDYHDEGAIPIIARVGGHVVGAVRCYPNRPGVWFSGRLAVLPEYRTGHIGPLLVRKVMEVMTSRSDVRRLLALIQLQHVLFFKHHGWLCLGKPFNYHGREHQMMERILERTVTGEEPNG
jgi:putative N-acetyltransferase (TIGR04045 family)